MGKQKRKVESLQLCSTKKVNNSKGEEEEPGNKEFDHCGILLPLCHQAAKSHVTFVLEKASLSLAYVGKRYQILSSDEHADYLRKKDLNPYNYRPDIVHEALLQIMSSRLCMSGRLKAIYVRTDEGILIKIEPNAHLPKLLRSFCNMMAQLLQKLSIKAVGKRRKLLSVVDNPITKHLPANTHKIGLSYSSQKIVNLREYVNELGCSEDFVFVVGVMAHGKIESDYVDDLISGLLVGCARPTPVPCLWAKATSGHHGRRLGHGTHAAHGFYLCRPKRFVPLTGHRAWPCLAWNFSQDGSMVWSMSPHLTCRDGQVTDCTHADRVNFNIPMLK